jgi:hypothetical protein
MKKIIILIVALLIGVGFQPTSADEISIIKESTYENDAKGVLDNGIILFVTLYWEHPAKQYFPDSWIPISCEDLDTGEITEFRTNFLGFRFKFFPRGHDFRIQVYGRSYIIEDLGFFYHAEFRDDLPLGRLLSLACS